MTNRDALERLAGARPDIASRTTEVLDAQERVELLASIVSSEAKGSGRRPGGWGLVIGGAVGGAVAAAAVAVALVVTSVHAPDASGAIVAKATTAIDGHTRGVFAYHEVQYGPGTQSIVSDGWWDLHNTNVFRMEIFSARSQPYEFGGYVQNGTAMRISLNSSQRVALISAAPGSSLAPHEPSVATLKAQLRSGSLRVLGHQRVDGIDALHLRGRSDGQQIDLWIDLATYNIVRFQLVGKGIRIVEDPRWLAPTPANLALLNVVVPPGYQRLEVALAPATTHPGGGGGSKTSAPPTSQPAEALRAVLVPTSSGSPAALQQDASTIRARLRALGDKDMRVVVTRRSLSISGRVSPSDLRLVGTTGAFTIRPVLCGAPAYQPPPPGGSAPPTALPPCQPQDVITAATLDVNPATGQPAHVIGPDPDFAPYPDTAPPDDDPDVTVLLPGDPAAGAQQYPRFVLGPADSSGPVVTAAHAQLLAADASWFIDVTLSPGSAAQWDVTAEQSFHQMVAFDLDGQVLSEPLIQPQNTTFSPFDREVQFSGDFTGSTARGLAAVLGSGPLSVPLEIRSLNRIS